MPERSDIQKVSVAATESAGLLGNKLAANMFMLGFIQQLTSLVDAEALCEVISHNVPQKYIALNDKAARSGMALAKEMNVKAEV
jgi:2-oxoglutarate ferredoxin oxidoreductase subunit gamma